MTKNIPISKLEVNKGQIEGLPKNPRFIKDDRFEALKKSIQDAPEMLALRELIVYPFGDKFIVIGGNMRLRACKDLGYKEIPCKVLDETTPPEKLREYTIKDNVAFGKDDFDILANEWEVDELVDFGMENINFGDDDDVTELESNEDDFDIKNEKIDVICTPGDIWELGEHRLMCCDSMEEENIEKLLNGETAALTLTDPPYKYGEKGGGIVGHSNVMNEIKTNKVDDFDPLKLKLYSKTNIYSHNKPLIKDYILLSEKESKAYDLCIYKKQGMPNYKGHLMTDIEYIAIIGEQDPNKGYEFGTYSKVFEGTKDHENKLSYSKPIALCDKFIKLYSKNGDIVLDTFGGSGSTLIACEQLNRRCCMAEIDPHYCDVIIARWEKLTGKKAIKLN